MKKWVEYQLKTQVTDLNWDRQYSLIGNVDDLLGSTFKSICENFESGKLTSEQQSVHIRDDWRYRSSQSTGGEVSVEEVSQWMDEYRELLERQTHTYINHFGEQHDTVVNSFAEKFNLEPGSIVARIQLFRPGDHFVVHIDRNRYKVWHKEDEMRYHHVKSHKEYQIFITFLRDQELGQMFQLGKNGLRWKAGDTYTWVHQNVPHCTANVGYWDNYILVVEGVPKDTDNQ